MNGLSYFDVFGIEHEGGDEGVVTGEIVRTGSNLGPHYQVIAIHAQMAWVRCLETGRDGLTPVARCRRVNDAPR